MSRTKKCIKQKTTLTEKKDREGTIDKTRLSTSRHAQISKYIHFKIFQLGEKPLTDIDLAFGFRDEEFGSRASRQRSNRKKSRGDNFRNGELEGSNGIRKMSIESDVQQR